MALPENRIKKIKLPDNTEYTIVPEQLQSNGHSLSVPSLSQDSTVAVKNIDNEFSVTQTFNGGINTNYIHTTDNETGLFVEYTESQGTSIVSSGHFTTDGDNDDVNTNKPDDETEFSDLDTDYFNTGVTLRDSESDDSYKLSFPAKSGVFATVEDTQIPIEDLTQLNS